MTCHRTNTNSRDVIGQVLTTREWLRKRKLHIQRFMPRDLRPDRNIAAGKRLKLARHAFGFEAKGDQGRFAQEAGLRANRYNQWETGERYPPAEYLVLLCAQYPGLTTDWVYRAEMAGLPHWLAKRLTELMAEDDQPPPRAAAPVVQIVPSHKAKIVPAPRRRRAS